MKEPSKKLELKNYLKERERTLQTTIIDKITKNQDASVERYLLNEIAKIINICESRNRY